MKSERIFEKQNRCETDKIRGEMQEREVGRCTPNEKYSFRLMIYLKTGNFYFNYSLPIPDCGLSLLQDFCNSSH